MLQRFCKKVTEGKAPKYFTDIFQQLQREKRSRYFKVPTCKNYIGQRSFQYRFRNLQNAQIKDKMYGAQPN